MKNFFIALQFLTIFPIKIKQDIKEKDFGKSLIFFPLVGVIIGLILAGFNFIFIFLPKPVVCSLVLIISVFISGGLHLDGFADTCDAFYGQNSKQKILEIMRDSRIGVMGSVGVVCLLLLKFNLILSIPENILWKSLILMTAFSRWSIVWSCYISNYSRTEGKAKYFIEYNSKREFILGLILVITLFFIFFQSKGLILFAGFFIFINLLVYFFNKKIDGMTGDTIGAVNEISEVLVLLGCVLV